MVFSASAWLREAAGRELKTLLIVPENTRHAGLSIVWGETGAGFRLLNTCQVEPP